MLNTENSLMRVSCVCVREEGGAGAGGGGQRALRYQQKYSAGEKRLSPLIK